MNRENIVNQFWENHDKLKTLDPGSDEYLTILFKNRKLCDKITGDQL